MKNTEKLEDIKDKIIPLLRLHSVKRAASFGSFVRGERRQRHRHPR